MSLHSAQFLRVGGDPQWLQGLEAAPPRLRHLDHINKVLAHQPWLTSCPHIQVESQQPSLTPWSPPPLGHSALLQNIIPLLYEMLFLMIYTSSGVGGCFSPS